MNPIPLTEPKCDTLSAEPMRFTLSPDGIDDAQLNLRLSAKSADSNCMDSA